MVTNRRGRHRARRRRGHDRIALDPVARAPKP